MSRSPTGSGGGRRTRVKTARGRKIGSTRWLERQLNDPYVKRARAEGYRSRAAYKLVELDERFGFLKGAKRVIDLGIAPGGWAQIVRQRLPQAILVGIETLLISYVPQISGHQDLLVGVLVLAIILLRPQGRPRQGGRGVRPLYAMTLTTPPDVIH